jgi:hypothetical protein
MGKHEGPDRPGRVSDLPQIVLVEITVLPDPDSRTRRERIAGVRRVIRRRAIVALALVLVLVLAILGAAGGTLLGDRDAGRQLVNALARERGPAGVAAAYGYPLGCLSVTILATDHAYARADFNHMSPCGRYTGYPTAIFHYVTGAWRPVLDAIDYVCPVDSLPAAIQTELDVCLQASSRRGRSAT